MKKRLSIALVSACIVLLMTSNKCVYHYRLIADGECVSSLSDIPEDSIFGVMGANIETKHKFIKSPARIEQYVKAASPFILFAHDVRITSNDTVELAFSMKDVFNHQVDSIMIDTITLIAFDIKDLKGVRCRNDDSDWANDPTYVNPIIKLVEKPRYLNDSIVIKFDFNNHANGSKDKRFETLNRIYCENGVYGVLNYYFDKYELRPFYFYSEEARALERLREQRHKERKTAKKQNQ